jgi:inosose dehydratase
MRQEQRFAFGYHLNTWDLSGQPLDRALDFLHQTGFEWFEALAGDTLGSDFARRHMTLGEMGAPPLMRDIELFERLGLFGRASEERGIRLSSLYINAAWVDDSLWRLERDAIHVLTRFLHSCGSPVLVCGGGPPAPEGSVRQADDYQAFARRLAEAGRFASELGIAMVYHPHLDCFVQTRDELDRLMDVLDTDHVGLCIDPAHLVIRGSDPVEALRTYSDAVRYVHFKDCKGDVTHLEGNSRYLSFCELGQGLVDLKGMTAILLESGYDGLVVIELDASEKTGEESCRESVTYIQDVLGLTLDAAA